MGRSCRHVNTRYSILRILNFDKTRHVSSSGTDVEIKERNGEPDGEAFRRNYMILRNAEKGQNTFIKPELSFVRGAKGEQEMDGERSGR